MNQCRVDVGGPEEDLAGAVVNEDSMALELTINEASGLGRAVSLVCVCVCVCVWADRAR